MSASVIFTCFRSDKDLNRLFQNRIFRFIVATILIMAIFEASQGPFIIRAEILALENYGFWSLTHLKRVWKN